MHLDSSLFDSRSRCAAMIAAVAIALTGPAAVGQAASEVKPFAGHYEGQRKVLLLPASAAASIELRRSSHFIVYSMQSTVTWAFIERRFRDCSVIRIEDDRLRPIEYLHRDESSPELDIRTRFDWSSGQAVTTLGRGSEPRTVELEVPIWDPLSFQVALMALAPQRRPGDQESHRVIERGALKAHEVSFKGVMPPTAAGGEQPVYEIVSRKSKGQLALWLLPDESWRPARVTIDDVTIRLVSRPVAAPAPLPEGLTPSCETVDLE